MEYNVRFPGEFDEYDWVDVEAKGWLGDVLVSWSGGERSLTFFDRSRLDHAIGVDIERLGYFAGNYVVVVGEVNRASIEAVVSRMADREFLDIA